MPYNLSPSLFVEHGPAVQAQRARSSARVFNLLQLLGCHDEPRPLAKAA